MEITASMVKELREMTGAGVMACKKALVETDGNFDAAIELLRKRVKLQLLKKLQELQQKVLYLQLLKEIRQLS